METLNFLTGGLSCPSRLGFLSTVQNQCNGKCIDNAFNKHPTRARASWKVSRLKRTRRISLLAVDTNTKLQIAGYQHQVQQSKKSRVESIIWN